MPRYKRKPKYGRKKVYRTKRRYTKKRSYKRRNFLKKGKRNYKVGDRYSGEEEIEIERISLATANFTKIYRFDWDLFPRLSSLSDRWQWIKIKKATVSFKPCQNATYWFSQQALSDPLRAITYMNMDGTDDVATTYTNARNRPYSKMHMLAKGFTRTYFPQCIKQVQLQDSKVSYKNIIEHTNPWLRVHDSADIDRVGPGVFIPKIVGTGGAVLFYKVSMKISYSLKGIRA